MKRAFLMGALVAAAMVQPASAHHGWSEYDANKLLTLKGTVSEVGFSAPHTHIKLQADSKTWMVVLAPPSRMSNRGLPDGSLKKGVAVEVHGYPHKTDPVELRAERIVVDGKIVELR
jgi:hypothetical protein